MKGCQSPGFISSLLHLLLLFFHSAPVPASSCPGPPAVTLPRFPSRLVDWITPRTVLVNSSPPVSVLGGHYPPQPGCQVGTAPSVSLRHSIRSSHSQPSHICTVRTGNTRLSLLSSPFHRRLSCGNVIPLPVSANCRRLRTGPASGSALSGVRPPRQVLKAHMEFRGNFPWSRYSQRVGYHKHLREKGVGVVSGRAETMSDLTMLVRH